MQLQVSTIKDIADTMPKHVVKTSKWIFPCDLSSSQEIHFHYIQETFGKKYL